MRSISKVLVRVGVVGSMVFASLGWGLSYAGASGVSLSKWSGAISAETTAFETTYTSIGAALKGNDAARARTLFEKVGTLAVNLATYNDSSSTVLNNAVVVFNYDMNQWAWDGYIAVGDGAAQDNVFLTATHRLTAAAATFTKDLKKAK